MVRKYSNSSGGTLQSASISKFDLPFHQRFLAPIHKALQYNTTSDFSDAAKWVCTIKQNYVY